MKYRIFAEFRNGEVIPLDIFNTTEECWNQINDFCELYPELKAIVSFQVVEYNA